jgi:hypothetical protein
MAIPQKKLDTLRLIIADPKTDPKLRADAEACLVREATFEERCPWACYEGRPIEYAERFHGFRLTQDQKKMCTYLLQPPYRLHVDSAHGVGKSWLMALLTNWFFDTYDPGVAITTGPSDKSVRQNIWGRVREMRQDIKKKIANYPFAMMPSSPEMKTGESHWAVGQVAAKAEAFQGKHWEYMFFGFDESEGLPEIYFETTTSMFKSNGKHFWFSICNPLSTSSPVYLNTQKIDYVGQMLWRLMSVSALNHDNIKIQMNDEGNDTGVDPPIPGAVTLDQIDDWITEYGCDKLGQGEKPQPGDFQWRPKKTNACPECGLIFQNPVGGVFPKHGQSPTKPDGCEGTGLIAGNWWRPSGLAESRILGRRPSHGVEGIWSSALWEYCENRTEETAIPFPLDEFPEFGCFVAGTLVETKSGPVPIEQLNAGDMVLTRQGYKRVKAAFCTGIQQTHTLVCENGQTLTGTGNHPIWDGHGWKSLGSLTNHDIIYTWKPANTNTLNMTELFGIENRKRNGYGSETISADTFQDAAIFPDENTIRSIGMFGKNSTGRFRKASASTIRTKTRPITTSLISNYSRDQSTVRFIRTTGESSEQVNVNFAEKSISTLVCRLDSVPTNANAHGEEKTKLTMRPEHAANAQFHSRVANTNQPQLVPVSVRTRNLGKLEEVYNITVEDCHEYFANGVLVHNCDVARFGDDATGFHGRWGGVSLVHDQKYGWDTNQIAGRLKEMCDEMAQFANAVRLAAAVKAGTEKNFKPFYPHQFPVKIDCTGGWGGGVRDKRDNYNFIEINSSSTAYADLKYPNIRSELWFQVAERARMGLLDLSRLDEADRQALKIEALAVKYSFDSAGRKVVEKKDETKKRLKRSPDNADSFCLAFLHHGQAVPHMVGQEMTSSRGGHETLAAKFGTLGRGPNSTRDRHTFDYGAQPKPERRFKTLGRR